MTKLLAVFIIVFAARPALANRDGNGARFGAGFGYPSVSITNPDSSTAYYTGLSFQGLFMYPISTGDTFRIFAHVTARFMDLRNTGNSGEIETAQHFGGGPGLTFELGYFDLGADYLYMAGRHYAVGPLSASTQYNYMPVDVFAGFRIPFGSLSVGISYSVSMGNIPTTDTGLSKASAYNDSVFWLTLLLTSDFSFRDLGRDR